MGQTKCIWNESYTGTAFIDIKLALIKAVNRNLSNCLLAWKLQDVDGVQTCDLTIRVRCSNQRSYEATEDWADHLSGWTQFWNRPTYTYTEYCIDPLKWPTLFSVASYLSWIKRRTSIARWCVQTPLKSWIFQAYKESLKLLFHCVDQS